MAAPRMVARHARAGSIVVARLAYGEDLLASLQDICRREKIRNGVIVTGFGSLTDIAVTGVVGPAFPPRRFYKRTHPRGVEILAISGVIADYHVHAHLVLGTRARAFGGHLEPGCVVLSLAEIVIMRVDGVKLARRLDPGTGQKLLQAVRAYGAGRRPDQEGSLISVQKRLAGRR
ncbi:MAG TPA: PPC domain-containing DNA-binding protein [Methylomirabilota bacterium]|nr:PPC domain-containing DNA-binding protein [Methylomirabilota bacterium]